MARSTLADMLVRLRCDACNARPESVHLTETPPRPNADGNIVPGWHLLLHAV